MCAGGPAVGGRAAWKTIPPIAHLLNHLLAGRRSTRPPGSMPSRNRPGRAGQLTRTASTIAPPGRRIGTRTAPRDGAGKPSSYQATAQETAPGPCSLPVLRRRSTSARTLRFTNNPGPFLALFFRRQAPPVALNDPWPENTESPRPPSGSSSSGRTGLTCLKSESPPGVDWAAPWKTNRLWVGDELPVISLLNRGTVPTRLSTANDSQAGPGRYAASRVEGG